MEMSFSRGLFTGWFGGTDNQKLVHARFGKKRGVFLGEVKRVLRDGVVVNLAAPLKPGDGVNLERSVRPTDRLSGHIVRGVVEGTATIQSMEPEGDATIVRFSTPPELLRYMVVKGPVAIDGTSLTIIDKTADTFAVSLVQYTLEHTNVLRKRIGDSVNIETDIIARYVETLFPTPRT